MKKREKGEEVDRAPVHQAGLPSRSRAGLRAAPLSQPKTEPQTGPSQAEPVGPDRAGPISLSPFTPCSFFFFFSMKPDAWGPHVSLSCEDDWWTPLTGR